MDWSVSLLILSCVATLLNAEEVCSSVALGMENGSILDEAVSSSSFQPGSEPKSGRHGATHGAWCPANDVDMNSYEWLQVDFRQMVSITHVLLSGEFNDGDGTRFTRKYRLEYQRTEGDQWQQYAKPDGTQVFPGTVNARNSKLLTTPNTLHATRVRVIPLAEVREEACLRIEFYGCFRQGIASYSAPPGDSRSDRYSFTDDYYDGVVGENSRLTGGLGLLTNGTVGEDDFSSSSADWLGWKSDSRSNVVLLFEMDHLRNISAVRIHCNNQHSKDIGVFKRATIYTSISGPVFSSDSVSVYDYVQDMVETSRAVPIQLNNVVARFIKIVLDFDEKWIMLSEVTFTSRLVVGPYSDETASPVVIAPPTTPKLTLTSDATTMVVIEPSTTAKPVDPTTDVEIVVKGGNPDGIDDNNNRPTPIDGSLIGIIVGSCVGAILVVIFIIIVCCVYQRKKPATSTGHDFSTPDDSTMSLPPIQKSHHADSSEYDLPWSRPLPHLPQSGATLQSSGYMSDGAPYACIPLPIEQYNNCQQSNCQQQHPHAMNSARQSPCLHHYMTSGGLLTLPGIHHERHNCNNRPINTLPAHSTHNNLLIPLPNKGPLGYDLNSYDLVQPDPCASPYDSSNYRSSPTAPLPNIQGGTGSSVYGANVVLPNTQLEDELPNISADSLRFLEKLGAGQYGEVHLCEMTTSTPGDNSKLALAESRRLVAVKKLQQTANEATKNDFVREIRIMSKLKHENIVQVLGVCTATSAADSPCVVTEYMSRGDLHQFLQKHVPEGTALLNKQTLNQSTLLHIAKQISHGMSYLEQLNVTHRDLAARNCLVGENHQVKISDFGMSRSLYSQQYYKVEGRVVLPIRWMAWESVLLGKFTTKSDVWSFGVTLWEIFSFAREQPFSKLSDDDVIANCMNYYSNNIGEVISLSQPSQCSKEIFDLMRACWHPIDFSRPTFKDINLFLQRISPFSQNPKPDRRMSLTRLTTC